MSEDSSEWFDWTEIKCDIAYVTKYTDLYMTCSAVKYGLYGIKGKNSRYYMTDRLH
jgi:hypothetical protein